MGSYQYGILLPHFGSEARRERIVEDSVKIENYGFDSVWVRDHLIYHPHEYEDQNRTFIDPFVALSAIAAVTKKITLATGALIPHRNPVHAALLVGSLDFIAGPGRLLIGWGIGTYSHEFDAALMTGWDRREVLPEQIEIQRALWTGQPVTYDGQFYKLTDAQIAPVPAEHVPIWYCGTSPAAVRRAVEYCDGWIPGRMPRSVFVQRMSRMRRLAEEAGKPVPSAGVIPWVIPGRTVEEASARLDLDQLFAASQKKGYSQEAEPLSSVADFDGGIIAGPSDVIIEEVRKYQEVGSQHFVFDLRACYEQWEESLELLGTEVLPELRRGDK